MLNEAERSEVAGGVYHSTRSRKFGSDFSQYKVRPTLTNLGGSSRCIMPLLLCRLGKDITSVPQLDRFLNIGDKRRRETDS